MPEPQPSRVRILEGALDLFAARGYDATSVREICEAAGITKPTLYHFYGSKEGVFRAVVGSALADTQRMVDGIFAAGRPLDETLAAVAREFFADARRRPRFWRLVFGTVWSPTAGPVDDVHAFYRGLQERLREAIESAATRGEVSAGPTGVRQVVLMGAISEAVTNYLVLDGPELSDDLADTLVATVIEGWRAGRPR